MYGDSDETAFEDDDPTVACPHCAEEIYDDVEQCPHCHTYLSPSDFKKPLPMWVLVVIGLTILSILLPTLLRWF